MDLGVIEIKCVDEIFSACQICACKESHLHYYVVKKERKYKTFGDCLIDQRSKMKTYAENKGIHRLNKDFLSSTNVRDVANKVWKMDGHPLEMNSFACETLIPNEAVVALVLKENFKGFVA